MKGIQIIVDNKNFESLIDIAKFYNISDKTLTTRLSRGWSIEEAVGILPPSKSHKALNAWLKKQEVPKRCCSVCKEIKPLTEYYPRSQNQTGTHYSGCKSCIKEQEKRRWNQRNYSISLDQREQLFKTQNQKCAICLESNILSRHWHLDHDHQTNKIRGILCRNCNLLLGMAKDSIVTLQNAIQYLKSHSLENDANYVDPEEIA